MLHVVLVEPVAAQVRAMFPQFWGISGSTSTMLSMTPPSLPGQKKAGNCFNNAHC